MKKKGKDVHQQRKGCEVQAQKKQTTKRIGAGDVVLLAIGTLIVCIGFGLLLARLLPQQEVITPYLQKNNKESQGHANNQYELYTQNTGKILTTFLELWQQFYQKDNEVLSEDEKQSYGRAMRDVREALLAVRVPEEYKAFHLALVIDVTRLETMLTNNEDDLDRLAVEKRLRQLLEGQSWLNIQ